MKTIVKYGIVLLIFLPYRMSPYAKGSSFVQDLVVAFVAFGVAYMVTAAIWGAGEKQGASGENAHPQDQKRANASDASDEA
jgi:hypothetical protein